MRVFRIFHRHKWGPWKRGIGFTDSLHAHRDCQCCMATQIEEYPGEANEPQRQAEAMLLDAIGEVIAPFYNNKD